MRIYVVHPGASFSTSDVYDGLVWGLRAGGHEVLEGRLDSVLHWYGAAAQAGMAVGTMAADALSTDGLNLSALAAAPITRHILLTDPDLVIVVSCHNYNVHDVVALRRNGYRCAVLLTESPYFGDTERAIAEHFDVVFTNERSATTALRNAHGGHAVYLPHAYHPERHTPNGPRLEPVDVALIGSMFPERRDLLTGITWDGISRVVRGYDPVTGKQDIVSNADTAAYYRSALIALNPHRTTAMYGSGEHISHADSLNPRAYEIPACGGALHLCDDSRAELFEVYADSATWYVAGDAADCERWIRYYLRHHDRREAAVRAQREAVAPHHWGNRAAQLLEAAL